MIQRHQSGSNNLFSHHRTFQSPAIPFHAGGKARTHYFSTVGDAALTSVLLTLKELSEQNAPEKGWILVIGPTISLSKQLLEQFGIDRQRVLLVSQKQINHYDNLMRDALTCSTCEAVLSFLPAEHPALPDYGYLANKYQTKLVNHCTQVASHYVM